MTGVVWDFPLVPSPGDYDRLLLQPNGATTPYQSVTVQALRAASFGTTSERPAAPITGQQFLDTTLGQPLWYLEGTGWINAAGTSV